MDRPGLSVEAVPDWARRTCESPAASVASLRHKTAIGYLQVSRLGTKKHPFLNMALRDDGFVESLDPIPLKCLGLTEPLPVAGAAVGVQPNGMAVLDCLGLLSAGQAASARIDRMDVQSVSGRRLFTAGTPDPGAGLDHAIAVRRADLHRLLVEAVAGVAAIETRSCDSL